MSIPNAKHQNPLHSLKTIKPIIGPHFIENNQGNKVTVKFLTPPLHEFKGYNSRTWMQQDGATCHTSNVILPVVKETFPNKFVEIRRS